MHDLGIQIRTYVDATSKPLTVDDVMHVPVGTDPVRPITQRAANRPGWRVWVTVGIAAVVVLIVVGVVPVLMRAGSTDLATDNAPTPATTILSATSVPPTTVAPPDISTLAEPVSVQWDMAIGDLPTWKAFGLAPIVSNGSSFLGVSGWWNDTNQDSVFWDDVAVVRSVDGIEWETVRHFRNDIEWVSPIAAGGSYIMGDEQARNRCGNGDPTSCTVLVSADGLEWDVEAWNSDQSTVTQWIWRLEEPSIVLTSRPPDFDEMDAYHSVIIEFDDRLVLYGTDHDADHNFGVQESTDGLTWTQVSPLPPFAPTLTEEYLSAGWQSMWRCEFTANNGRAMALIGATDGLELWTTTDGVAWDQLPDPPIQPTVSGRDHCIGAVSDGWIIAPGGKQEEFGEVEIGPILTTPESILFSSDGIDWNSVDFPENVASFTGAVEVAGNRIFIFDTDTGDILVGTIDPI